MNEINISSVSRTKSRVNQHIYLNLFAFFFEVLRTSKLELLVLSAIKKLSRHLYKIVDYPKIIFFFQQQKNDSTS